MTRKKEIKMYIFIFALCCLLYSVNGLEYAHTQEILPTYTVSWNVDEEGGWLYLSIHVQTTGWVGFGLAEPTSGR